MTDETEKPVLDAQKERWESALETKREMFGRDPSEPARWSAAEFERAGLCRLLELGGGQGRDAFFFATKGFDVHVLDYAQSGVETITRKVKEAGLTGHLTVSQHDVRLTLPFPDGSFDACYSHMLFCMAFTTRELEALSGRSFLCSGAVGSACTRSVARGTPISVMASTEANTSTRTRGSSCTSSTARRWTAWREGLRSSR
jgi:hypothetical protein